MCFAVVSPQEKHIISTSSLKTRATPFNYRFVVLQQCRWWMRGGKLQVLLRVALLILLSTRPTAFIVSMTASSETISRPFEARNPSTGYRLAGDIVQTNPASKRICVLVHGLLSSRNDGLLRRLGEEIQYNTCRFDISGSGESEGPFCYAGCGIKGVISRVVVVRNPIRYEPEMSDLRTVVEELRREGWEVHALLGHSKGAHCVLRYAWTYDDVPNVISLSGRFDFDKQPKTRFTPEQMRDLEEKGWFMWTVRGKDYKITREDFLERNTVDMQNVAKIKHSKVLLLHGDADETIPVADAHELSRTLTCAKDMYIFRGGTHSFRSKEEADEVVAVVQQYLNEGTVPASGQGASVVSADA